MRYAGLPPWCRDGADVLLTIRHAETKQMDATFITRIYALYRSPIYKFDLIADACDPGGPAHDDDGRNWT